MSTAWREHWNRRHSRKPPGDPEPFVVEMLRLLPRGLALDVAAGRGRHSLLLASAGFRVLAVDYSSEAVFALAARVRSERLAIYPVLADLEWFPLRERTFDLVLNVNFLDRSLFSPIRKALRRGGFLVVDTFLIDQATAGHPRDPRFLLERGELRHLLSDFEVLRYREGMVSYPNGYQAWKASALAQRSG